MSDIIDNMETEDGRKVISVSTNELSVAIESSEQSARGRREAAEAEMAEIKLKSMKRGPYAVGKLK